MKTITAKDFRRRQSEILKEVAGGQTYQLTFHRKPTVVISPVELHVNNKILKPGSKEAVLDSFKYAQKGTGDVMTLSYKELRAKMIEEKHGTI